MAKLLFSNITLDVEKSIAFRKKEKLRILDDISGQILPGDFVAVMGPSGAGKTSLLNVLSGRNTRAQGSVIINNLSAAAHGNSSQSCFIQQEDLFYSHLSVNEHLYTQARLRLPLTKTECNERVAKTVKKFDLESCKDIKIGSAAGNRGISGGEQKRLSIASELLTNPPLIFADEPTTGLDAFMAENVVQSLKHLARHGHTVIATVHQPSTDVFNCFNKVLILSAGKMVFFGNRMDLMPYFAKLGHECPPYTNLADFFMDFLAEGDEASGNELDKLFRFWREEGSKWALSRMDEILLSTAQGSPPTPPEDKPLNISPQPLNKPILDVPPLDIFESFVYPTDEVSGKPKQVAHMAKFRAVLKRMVLELARNPMISRARVTQTLFISIFSAFIFFRLSHENWYSKAGAAYFVALQIAFQSAGDVVFSLATNVPIVQREIESGLFSPWSFFIATNLSDTIMQIILPFLFLTTSWFLVGFRDNFWYYLLGLTSAFMTAYSSTGFGYIASALATKTSGIGNAILPVLLVPMLMAHPFLIAQRSVSKFWLWLIYLSPFRYGWSIQMYATFHNSNFGGPDCVASPPMTLCTGNEVLNHYSIYTNDLWTYYIISIALGLGARILAAFIFARAMKLKQNE